MHDYSRSLGVAVRKARKDLGLTQVKLAEMTGINSRTIIKIEGCEGNPMLENLYPLIRVLKIDPWEVFTLNSSSVMQHSDNSSFY